MEVGVFGDVTGDVSCWDLKTGVKLKSFKNSCCMRKGLAISKNQFVFSAQPGKQIIQIHRVNKDQVYKKVVCPEKISCLTVSPDGNYLLVGLLEKIYIWQVTTGNLMCVLSKHYQCITGIEFTDDGQFFVSYGNDNLLLIWDFSSVLQSSDSNNVSEQSNVSPLHVISNHSMAIQDVYIGTGGIRCHVVTCSIDQTCKIFDICSGALLCNFVFDAMCTSVAMDTMEKQLFVGTNDGHIFDITCSNKVSGHEEHVTLNNTELLFKGHRKSIACLRVTFDGLHLLSGSSDCTVKVWHILSKQCIRTFDFKGEVTNISLCSFQWFQPAPYLLHIHKENFKRRCYLPKEVNLAELENDVTDSVPVLLQDLLDDEHTSNTNGKDLLQCVLDENSMMKPSTDSLWEKSNKTITRVELEQKVAILEAMAQKFYGISTKALLNEVDTNGSEG